MGSRRATRRSFLANQKIAEHQRVHLRSQKAIQRFFRPANDRFIVVERGIKNHRHAGGLFERFDEPPVTRIDVARDRLQSTSSIHVIS